MPVLQLPGAFFGAQSVQPTHGQQKPSLSPFASAPEPVPGRFRRNKCQTELQPGGSVENGGATYQLVSRLGSGCFAEVFKAECAQTRSVVAVKVLPEDTENAARFHQKEAQRLLNLRHPNIVAAYDTFRFVGQQKIYTCIVMEFCAGGTLQNQIKTRAIQFTPQVINQYLYQISDGLDYLHNNSIIHGDCKSDNILLTRRGQAKITDFGHSRRTSEFGAPPMSGGDLMFAPPEYNKGMNLSTTFDMWSLGCILCEMATMSTMGTRSPGVPFANNPPAFATLTQDMMSAHGGMYYPLIRGLFVTDPNYRLTADQVRQTAAEMGGQVNVIENDDGNRAGRFSASAVPQWFMHRMTA